MNKTLFLAAASAALIATPAAAQSSTTSAADRIGQILGTIFGTGSQADNTLDGQWRLGRKPLATQRYQFDTRVDSDVRSGALTSATGQRLKSDYYALVQLEASYATGGFSTAERSELASRYSALTRSLTEGQYGDVGNVGDGAGNSYSTAEVRNGQAAFDARVDAAVSARRMTRTAGRRLKADYAALITTESNYLRDGSISSYEREDLENRLDRLDERVGDSSYGTTPATARSRLDAILRALPSAGLSTTARAQLLVEHGDLLRLESAYARLTPTTEERAYLERRLTDLEVRARITRY